MIFSKKRNLTANIIINDVQLHRQYETKFLGVILSAEFQRLSILSVYDKYKYQLLIYIYKISHGLIFK